MLHEEALLIAQGIKSKVGRIVLSPQGKIYGVAIFGDLERIGHRLSYAVEDYCIAKGIESGHCPCFVSKSYGLKHFELVLVLCWWDANGNKKEKWIRKKFAEIDDRVLKKVLEKS